MFTLVVDNGVTSAHGKNLSQGSRDGSGFLLALGMPAIGLSYYRLEVNSVKPSSLPTAEPLDDRQSPVRQAQLASLTTQNLGATLVQSLAPGIAVGTTLRFVHGLAAAAVVPDADRDALLKVASELQTTGTDKFDADVGVIAGSGHVKMGFTMRNLLAPSFNVRGSLGAADARASGARWGSRYASGWMGGGGGFRYHQQPQPRRRCEEHRRGDGRSPQTQSHGSQRVPFQHDGIGAAERCGWRFLQCCGPLSD